MQSIESVYGPQNIQKFAYSSQEAFKKYFHDKTIHKCRKEYLAVFV